MVNVIAGRLDAREKVIRCALEIAAIERRLADDPKALLELAKAERALEFASRDLANVVAELPPRQRPKNWDTTPGGDTA